MSGGWTWRPGRRRRGQKWNSLLRLLPETRVAYVKSGWPDCPLKEEEREKLLLLPYVREEQP